MLRVQHATVFDVTDLHGTNARRVLGVSSLGRSNPPPTHTHTPYATTLTFISAALFHLACSCAPHARSAAVLQQHAAATCSHGLDLWQQPFYCCFMQPINRQLEHAHTHTQKRASASVYVCVCDLLQAVINLRRA